MDTIVPRWEWRTFAARFGDAEQRLRSLPLGEMRASDELYFLSPHCDANVKVRDGLVDIKTLEQVDAQGLEQWRPLLKAPFPLSAAHVEQVCTALRVAPLPVGDACSLDAMRSALTQAGRGVRAVSIRKQRRRSSVGGCLAEVTDLVADGRATRSVALESEDPARVRAAILELGLEQLENLSYPRGLKRLLGWPA